MGAVANRKTLVLARAACAAAIACAPAPAVPRSLKALEAQLSQMQRDLAAQRSLIDEQARIVARQQEEIQRLNALVETAARPAEQPRRTEVAQTAAAPAPVPQPASPALPTQPVGESLGVPRAEQQVDVAVLQGNGVLTRAGHFMFEPSFEYTNSSNNRLVFRGVELIPGIQIGLIEASNADRDTMVVADTVRFGLTGNLELEARIPYLFRADRIEGVQQRQESIAQTINLKQQALGDIEVGLRYQFNHPIGQRPIFIGSLRAKTDTGKSPFSVPFDQFGVAQGLATGSGFWAIQPGMSFLLPSDPVVIFGGVSYLHQIAKDIDRKVGSVQIGRVDPGDAISGNIGFGFAINPRFSFSLGYQHNYIFPTRSEIDGVLSRSNGLQVGSLALGMSYRLTERQSLNLGVDVGATQDAPNVSMVLRLPFSPF